MVLLYWSFTVLYLFIYCFNFSAESSYTIRALIRASEPRVCM
ncbi:unnamed protein product, partial [Tenebrio molitor]